jgi:hypothetical protein
MTAPQAVQERINLTDKFYRDLCAAMEQRHLRPNLVDIPGGQECEWVGFERFAMLAVTNNVRRRRGLPEVSQDDIARVEQQACGHSDYARKYAMYCAELALGVEPT